LERTQDFRWPIEERIQSYVPWDWGLWSGGTGKEMTSWTTKTFRGSTAGVVVVETDRVECTGMQVEVVTRGSDVGRRGF
jgi:hypothetical protein